MSQLAQILGNSFTVAKRRERQNYCRLGHFWASGVLF